MNLFLIKLGKAFVAIERDGVFVGGRRVLSYLITFLKTILTFSSGDVLFITGGVGDSANYRSHNVAEELNLHGIKASVMIQDNPFLPRFADKFKIFVFHRTLFTPNVAKLIEKIKEQSKEIIFETDDLVFDTKYSHASDFYKNISQFEKKQYEKGVAEEILKDEYVKICTTTTSYLAKILESYGKNVFIVPNKLSKKDVEMADDILQNKKPRTGESVRIGYFSGTISHNKDFATITEALIQIMEKYPQVRLVLAGPLNIENRLDRFSSQIERLAFAPRDKHFENKANVDIALSPLEIKDPFCESKSELKFSESAILKVPVVAVRNQTFSEAITDGIDGFLADHTEEWVEKLSKLIENPELRKSMGEKAREKALRDYTTKNSDSEEYYNYLRSKL
jgi:glycosyltransferase involved in cell wall biosynthesis